MTHYAGVVLASSKNRAKQIAEFFGLPEDWFLGSAVIVRNGALRGCTMANRVIVDADQVLSRDTAALLGAVVARQRGQQGLRVMRVSDVVP